MSGRTAAYFSLQAAKIWLEKHCPAWVLNPNLGGINHDGYWANLNQQIKSKLW
jgi:hypothetical protein